MLTVRSAAFVLVGILTLVAPWPGAVDGSTEVAALAFAGIVMALWAAADSLPTFDDRFGRLLPYALGAMAVTSGAASALPGGGSLIALGVIAVIAVGSGARVITAWIVTGLAVAAVEVAGLSRGASDWATAEYPAVLLVALLLGFNRRAHRVQAEQSAALAARSEQLREEQARAAALSERARIAREIHDVLAHSLGALGVHIQLA